MSRHRIVGRIPVLECLRAGRRRPQRLYVLRDARGLDDLLAEAGAVPVEMRSRAELDQLVPDTPHQGVVLEAEPPRLWEASDWLRGEIGPEALAVALDEVEDPHNFGAIVRSAAACGASAVVFGKRRSAPLSAAAYKAAAGAMEWIDLIQVANLRQTLDLFRGSGFWAAALDAEAPDLLWDADLSGRIVLVVGNEGRGVRRLVSESCDFRLRIPLTGPITSLNASVSAAIAIAEWARKRHQRGGG